MTAISDKSPVLDASRLLRVLERVLDLTAPALGTGYRLVGTAAALLQGVPLPANDIDLLVNERARVDAAGAALAGFPCLARPAWLQDTRQYFAAYGVDGVHVEFSTVEVEERSDTAECFGRGPWERFVLISCGAHRVPAVALELRLITELSRGRTDRADALIEYLRAHGADLALVRRGLEVREFPAEARESLLRRLGATVEGRTC